MDHKIVCHITDNFIIMGGDTADCDCSALGTKSILSLAHRIPIVSCARNVLSYASTVVLIVHQTAHYQRKAHTVHFPTQLSGFGAQDTRVRIIAEATLYPEGSKNVKMRHL
jgi:hypothetical protein